MVATTIFGANKRNGKIEAKYDDIVRQAGQVSAEMTTMTNELEKYAAFMFRHSESFTPTDIVNLTAVFEARRTEMDALMTRLNAIGQIAPTGTLPADVPANVAKFIAATGYIDTSYSAQFD